MVGFSSLFVDEQQCIHACLHAGIHQYMQQAETEWRQYGSLEITQR